MIKYFKAKDAKITTIAESYKIYNMLTIDDSENVTVVRSEADNHYEITMNTDSDRAYYILAGKMILDGVSSEAGDVVYIPKNTEYQFEGTFEAIIVSSPAFNPKYDITSVSGPKKSL